MSSESHPGTLLAFPPPVQNARSGQTVRIADTRFFKLN
jgi:hypothetical protein